jgi:hypothetical protein
MMPQVIDIQNFIEPLNEVHKDSSQLMHYAKKPEDNGQELSTMPVTAFVYELFLYNSLYSVDWSKSLRAGKIVNYSIQGGPNETKKQKGFEIFLRRLAEDDPQTFRNAFLPLTQKLLEGDWTNVTPDANISAHDGKNFFNNLQALRDLVQQNENFGTPELDKAFDNIEKCRRFIYKIRNNVFHGTKDLGQIWDQDQKKRIDVYYQFLNCVVSCFFHLAIKAFF